MLIIKIKYQFKIRNNDINKFKKIPRAFISLKNNQIKTHNNNFHTSTRIFILIHNTTPFLLNTQNGKDSAIV